MSDRLFPLGEPVSEEDIVGREEFLNSLEMRLANGQNIMLAGPRRIGKTSLALQAIRRLKSKGYYVAFVDLFRLSSKQEFAQVMINACLANRSGITKTVSTLKDGLKKIAGTAKLRAKMQDLDIEFALDLMDKEIKADELLHYAFQLPDKLSKKDNKKLIVVFDEFQEVIRIAGEDILKVMRSYFQMQEKVTYLFLGSKEGLMNTIFGDKKQAFYRFATMLPIPPITNDAWEKYIRRKFEDNKIMLNSMSIDELLRLSGGHPQDTMLLCNEIYYVMLESRANQLTIDFVKMGYKRALLTLSAIFDAILDELGKFPNVMLVLVSLAKGRRIYSLNKHPQEIKNAIDLLAKKAIIEKTERGKYKFVEPMFQDYLLNKIEVF